MPHKDPAQRRTYAKAYSAKHYQANKAKKNAQSKQWRIANRDRAHEIARKSYRKNSTRPPRRHPTPEEKAATKLRNWRRKSWRRYGIDELAAASALQQHDGRCGICGAHEPAKRRRDWAVDHDHRTQVVRGILCHGCNMKLGWVDRVGLSAIQRYLEPTSA